MRASVNRQSTHLQSSLGLPGETQLVGQYSTGDCRPIVTSPAHHHHSEPGHKLLSAESHLSGAGTHLAPIKRKFDSQNGADAFELSES